MNLQIACLSPIENIDGLKEYLESFATVHYESSNTKEGAISLIRQNKCNTIFVNPNMLGYKLDGEVLQYGIGAVCTASTGTNHIDQDYCSEHDIQVLALTKDMDIIEKLTCTAEHAFGLMLALIRGIPASFDCVKDGEWDYRPFVGRQINSLKIGVVGYGRLGKMFARYASAFGAQVYVCDPYVRESQCPYMRCTLESLFKLCDVVSLHVHVSPETTHMVHKGIFSTPVYLINTSRGEIVNEEDVVDMLGGDTLLGYATDVIEDEFGNVPDSPVVKAIPDKGKNLIITPHIGGMTVEAQKIAYHHSASKLQDFV